MKGEEQNDDVKKASNGTNQTLIEDVHDRCDRARKGSPNLDYPPFPYGIRFATENDSRGMAETSGNGFRDNEIYVYLHWPKSPHEVDKSSVGWYSERFQGQNSQNSFDIVAERDDKVAGLICWDLPKQSHGIPQVTRSTREEGDACPKRDQEERSKLFMKISDDIARK